MQRKYVVKRTGQQQTLGLLMQVPYNRGIVEVQVMTRREAKRAVKSGLLCNLSHPKDNVFACIGAHAYFADTEDLAWGTGGVGEQGLAISLGLA